MAELEETISDAIVALLTTDPTLTDVKTVTFDRVKLAIDDFRDHEVPAIQMWDLAQIIEHQRGFVQVNWGIALEIVMKSLESGVVIQKTLWDLRRRVELVLWDKPDLEIPGVIHLLYRNNITDLHLLEPFYIARMEFEVLFRRQLTGSC